MQKKTASQHIFDNKLFKLIKEYAAKNENHDISVTAFYEFKADSDAFYLRIIFG